MTERKEFTFDRVVRLVIGVVVVLALLFLIHLLKNVLLPFLVACLIAYMFEPFVQYNRRLLHLRGRVIAVFVTQSLTAGSSRMRCISLSVTRLTSKPSPRP